MSVTVCARHHRSRKRPKYRDFLVARRLQFLLQQSQLLGRLGTLRRFQRSRPIPFHFLLGVDMTHLEVRDALGEGLQQMLRRVDAKGSVATTKDATIVLDTALDGRPDAFNPAEPFLASIAA
jgi:hypothetical protein